MSGEILSDEDVFGTTAAPKKKPASDTLSDAEVFGAPADPRPSRGHRYTDPVITNITNYARAAARRGVPDDRIERVIREELHTRGYALDGEVLVKATPPLEDRGEGAAAAFAGLSRRTPYARGTRPQPEGSQRNPIDMARLDSIGVLDESLPTYVPNGAWYRNAKGEVIQNVPGQGERLASAIASGVLSPIGGAARAIGDMDPFGAGNPLLAGDKITTDFLHALLGDPYGEVGDAGSDLTDASQVAMDWANAGLRRPEHLAVEAFTDPSNALPYGANIIAQSAPALAGALAMRDPAAAQAAIGAFTGAQQYGQDRAAGDDAGTAATDAAAAASLEAALEGLVFPRLLAPARGAPIRQFADAALAETAQEAITNPAQYIAGQVIHGEAVDPREAARQGEEGAVAGLAMGGGARAPFTAAELLSPEVDPAIRRRNAEAIVRGVKELRATKPRIAADQIEAFTQAEAERVPGQALLQDAPETIARASQAVQGVADAVRPDAQERSAPSTPPEPAQDDLAPRPPAPVQLEEGVTREQLLAEYANAQTEETRATAAARIASFKEKQRVATEAEEGPGQEAPEGAEAVVEEPARRDAGEAPADQQGPVAVYARTSEIPADVRARNNLNTTANSGVEGFYDPETGQAHVVEENLDTSRMSRDARIAWVVAHERSGHAGLRGAALERAGDDIEAGRQEMFRVLDEAAGNEVVRKIAEATAQEYAGQNLRIGRELAVEEALAELQAAVVTGNYAEIEARYDIVVPQAQRATLRGLFARLVESVRRTFGGKHAGEFSDADVYKLLKDARRFAKSGKVTPTSRPRGGAAPVASRIDFTPSPKVKRFQSGNTSITYHVNDSGVKLSVLRTGPAGRGGGSARAALQEFLAAADEVGLPVRLTAAPLDATTDEERLKGFYRSEGFEDDATTGVEGTMRRAPNKARKLPANEAQPAAAEESPPGREAGKAPARDRINHTSPEPIASRGKARNPYAQNQGRDLIGLPSPIRVNTEVIEFHGFAPAQEIAARFAARHGNTPPTTYASVDEARARRIAAAYEEMKHDPQDPEVKRAYAAMIAETLEQYREMVNAGVVVEFIEGDDPYAGSPRLAILDVVENNHLWVFPTTEGFGQDKKTIVLGERLTRDDAQKLTDYWNGIEPGSTSMSPTARETQARFGPRYDVVRVTAADDVSDNPLLAPTNVTFAGKPTVANDVFRAVHDYFGHIANGVGFRADGEENAWREHAAMYSPLARRAMTSETRGQNSWVNYGPYGAKNRTAKSEDTTYADQKTGLLPEWVSEDGATDHDAATKTPQFKAWFGDWSHPKVNSSRGPSASKVVNADGSPRVVYHGTDADITRFETMMPGLNTDEFGGNEDVFRAALFFAEDPKFAGQFGSGLGDAGPNVMPVYLNIRSPADMTTVASTSNVIDDAAEHGYNPRYARSLLRDRPSEMWALFDTENGGEAFVDSLKSAGYDGVILTEPNHATGKDATTWVAFDPNQVKSAVGNSGAFDPADDSIVASRATVTNTPEFKRWFGGSKVVDNDGNPLVVYHGTTQDFTEFDGAAFFTDDYMQADGYAGGENILDVFLKIENPYVVDAKGAKYNQLDDARGTSTRDIVARSKGLNDGVIFENINDDWIDDEDAGQVTTVYAVFRPEQVKSATGNSGAFDPENPSIIASRGWRAKKQQPDAIAVDAIHYSNSPNLKAIDPSYSGTGRIGAAQRRRFGPGRYGLQGGTSARAYFFVRDGSELPGTEGVIVGAHPYQVRLTNLYNQDEDPRGIAKRNANNIDAMEEEISEAGFDGLYSSHIGDGSKGAVAIVFDIGKKKIPVEPVDGPLASRQAPKPVFYSALVRTVEQAKDAPKKADAKAWKGWLDGAQRRGEIKADERDWIGVDAWLDEAGTVTREQLADFVRANQVNVSDVVAGQDASEQEIADNLIVLLRNFVLNYRGGGHATLSERDWKAIDDYSNGVMSGYEAAEELGINSSDIDRLHRQAEEESHGGARFANYTLPGGKNYRELLLTLPHNEGTVSKTLVVTQRGDGSWQVSKPNGTPMKAFRTRLEAERYVEHNDPGGVVPGKNFSTEHFPGVSNILAHIRFNERTDGQGRRVLFIEEVQSDWHQAGRKRGYQPKKPDTTGWSAKPDELPNTWKVFDQDGGWVYNTTAPDAENAIARAAAREYPNRVPDAPFKTTWPILAFKRAVRWAVENGFDRIAWTTGDQQNERYQLSKSVQWISWEPGAGGREVAIETARGHTIRITVNDDGAVIMGPSELRDRQLDDVVGGAVASRIMAKPLGFIDTEGLKVGGQGMRGFYDRILPNEVQKWVKRFGGRVSEGQVSTRVPGDYGVQGMREHPITRTWHQDDTQTVENRLTGESRTFATRAESDAWMDQQMLMVGAPTVHTLDITSGMREAVEEGQPLFSRKAIPNARARQQGVYTQMAAQGVPQGTPSMVGGRLVGLRDGIDAIREKLQDKMLRVLRAQEQATQPVTDAMDAYTLENLMHGRAADQLRLADRDFVLKLSQAMKRTGVTLDQLQDVLLALHAPERNAKIATINQAFPDGGSGITTADARGILAGTVPGPYSGKTLTPDVITKARNMAAIVQQMRHRTLDILEQSHQITPQLAATLRSTYQHYVPLRGRESDDIFPDILGTGRGLSHARPKIDRALGRTTLAQNILGEAIGDLQRAIVQAEKARVTQAFLRFAIANPMPDLFTVSPVDLEWKFSEATGEAYLGVRSEREDADRSMIVPFNGKPVRIRFEDPRLRDAMMNLSINDMSGFVRIFGAINRWRSAVLTRFNPGFAPVNLVRDFIFGMNAVSAELGPKIAAQTMAGYGPAFKALLIDSVKPRGNAQATNKTWDDWAREYVEAGGKTGLAQAEQPRDLQKQLSIASTTLIRLAAQGRVGRAGWETVKRATTPLANAVEHVNDATENALRLAVYVAQRKAGKSVQQAAEYAKNVTINFNRKGHYGPVINSLYLFFNASMQGTHAVARVIKKPQVLGTLTTLTALQFMWAAALMGDDDDDGISSWDSIPDYVKRTSLVIPLGTVTGGKADYFALPMPYGFNLFPYLGGRAAQWMAQGARPTDSSVGLDALKATTEAFSPVPVDEGYRSLFGDQIGLALELAANKDDLGRPIVQEGAFEQYPVPMALKGRADTARPYQVASQLLAKAGGGDLEKRIPPVGYLDVAPEQLETMVSYFTGGLGNIASKGSRWWDQLDAGNLQEPMDVIGAAPIASRFVDRPEIDKVIAERYYGERGILARNLDRLKDAVREGADPEKALADLQAEEPGMSGVDFKRYKRKGKKGQQPGDIRRSDTGAPVVEPKFDSSFDQFKDTEQVNEDVARAIRNLRNPKMTNADAKKLIDAAFEDYTAVEVNINFGPDNAPITNAVRQRAIKALQDKRRNYQRAYLVRLRRERQKK